LQEIDIRLLLTSAASFDKLLESVQALSHNRHEDKFQACLEHNIQFVKGSYLPCTQFLITDITVPWTCTDYRPILQNNRIINKLRYEK